MTRPDDVTLKPSELPMWGPCSAPKTVDPADELGKVWDVLHAAGINGAGGMSASEGVKLLTQKVPTNVELMDAYQAAQERLVNAYTLIDAVDNEMRRLATCFEARALIKAFKRTALK